MRGRQAWGEKALAGIAFELGTAQGIGCCQMVVPTRRLG